MKIEIMKDRSLRTIVWNDKTMDAWYDPRDGVELTRLVYQGVDLIDIMTDSQIEEVEDILREWEQDYWTGS